MGKGCFSPFLSHSRIWPWGDLYYEYHRPIPICTVHPFSRKATKPTSNKQTNLSDQGNLSFFLISSVRSRICQKKSYFRGSKRAGPHCIRTRTEIMCRGSLPSFSFPRHLCLSLSNICAQGKEGMTYAVRGYYTLKGTFLVLDLLSFPIYLCRKENPIEILPTEVSLLGSTPESINPPSIVTLSHKK